MVLGQSVDTEESVERLARQLVAGPAPRGRLERDVRDAESLRGDPRALFAVLVHDKVRAPRLGELEGAGGHRLGQDARERTLPRRGGESTSGEALALRDPREDRRQVRRAAHHVRQAGIPRGIHQARTADDAHVVSGVARRLRERHEWEKVAERRVCREGDSHRWMVRATAARVVPASGPAPGSVPEQRPERGLDAFLEPGVHGGVADRES